MLDRNASGPSAGITRLATGLDWHGLPPEVRASARDHLLDTLGVIVAGMPGEVAQATARVLTASGGGGTVRVPGSELVLSADAMAFLCGTAAHGIELDDGYREGTVHPGVAVVPALLALAGTRRVTGPELLTALTVGYEVICATAAAGHPALRQRGFHPTSATGPLGAAMASANLLGLDDPTTASALGIAASHCGGLFAFLGGGGDVKRLHGGLGARGGLQAALLAEAGIGAPQEVIETGSGYAQAFTGGPMAFDLPPAGPFRILGCYYKPYACCRHLQPAFEAVIEVMQTQGLRPADVQRIEVETYAISSHHADVGWDDFASAQLSFPYLIALAVNRGTAALSDFDDATRAAPWVAETAAKLHVRAAPDLDARYPAERPSRVALLTSRGRFTAERAEAAGSPEYPVTAAMLKDKFLGLTVPVLGQARADSLYDALMSVDTADDVADLLALSAMP